MANNPTISDAKSLALKHRCRGVIILAFSEDHFGCASYGITRSDCDAMKHVLNRIYDLLEEGKIELPDSFRAFG